MEATTNDSSEAFFDRLEAKYELRPQSRKVKNAFTTTWIDQDDTGDYDPSEEVRKEKARKVQAKLRARKVIGQTSDSNEGETVNGRRTYRTGPRLMARIAFTSELGKRVFRECVETSRVTGESKYYDNLLNGYVLQSTRSGTSNQPYDDGPRHIPNLPDDLTGHPIARGCWECLSLGRRCPLLDDEHAWPCTSCFIDDHDCDLITPPTVKQACERCKRRCVDCSYTSDTDHNGGCQQCDHDGYRCVAGPAEGTVRSRIRIDGDYVQAAPSKPTKPQEIWTCMQCREANRQCSFSTGGYGDDCAACEKKGNICFPERTLMGLPTPLSSKRKKKHRQNIEYQPSPAKRAKKVKGGDQKAITIKSITTKFCHPILFNHKNLSGDQPCQFCDGSAYALVGLEPRKVEVDELNDGYGLREISGGHKSEGKEQSRMCMPCTVERAAIIMCDRHDMRRIPGVSSSTLDYDGAFTAVFESDQMRKNDRWCSLCLDLATHECAASQVTDVKDAQDDGCGLALCEQCAAGMKKGDLQRMLGEIEDEERAFGPRADYEFLKKDGLLMQFVIWTSKQ